jgi:hypothetical protein
MAAPASAKSADRDPETVVGLIYRIVDEPRRAIIFASLLLPAFALIIQLSTAAKTTIAGISCSVVWWGGTTLWEACWSVILLVGRRKRRQGTPAPTDGDREAGASQPLAFGAKPTSVSGPYPVATVTGNSTLSRSLSAHSSLTARLVSDLARPFCQY